MLIQGETGLAPLARFASEKTVATETRIVLLPAPFLGAFPFLLSILWPYAYIYLREWIPLFSYL